MSGAPIPVAVGCWVVCVAVGDGACADDGIIELDIRSLVIGLTIIIGASCRRAIYKTRYTRGKWRSALIENRIFGITSAVIRTNIDDDIRAAIPVKRLAKRVCVPANDRLKTSGVGSWRKGRAAVAVFATTKNAHK